MASLIAFDADVLIYAAVPNHPLGKTVAALFVVEEKESVGIGSVLLLHEVLVKPLRQGTDASEVDVLLSYLSRLQLRPCDQATAQLALQFGVKYGLRTADSVHLATAVSADCDYFLTNNRRNFPDSISEIQITYPEALPSVE